MKPLTFGSLFAGIGGLDLGFERAGWNCLWQVEKDPWKLTVLDKHWPRVRKHNDITTFPPDDFFGDEHRWRVDAIIGGFPCKQTSNAASITGNRNGLDGKDSRLWWQMHRVINVLHPPVVVVENVAGALTWSDTITAGLADSGYAVRQLRLPAFLFGAPHQRRRIFFVADINRARLEITWQERSSEIECKSGGAVTGNYWTKPITGIRGMGDGLSAGVDRRQRIHALGDACVPQVAEWIGRRIAENFR